MKSKRNRNMELLFEVSAFRHFPRAWAHWLGQDTANHAEHTFRTAFIALMIARLEGRGDVGKIVTMALLHDLPESRCTDVDHIQRQYVTRNEDLATKDMFEGTVLAKEAEALLAEYHERKSIESQIVKDADLLDADVEFREVITSGRTLHAKHIGRRRAQVKIKMFTKTAKRLFEEIHKADPNDWHLLSQRNRFNGGDWKVSK
jgi:putative hydrolase of HD superfamily